MGFAWTAGAGEFRDYNTFAPFGGSLAAFQRRVMVQQTQRERMDPMSETSARQVVARFEIGYWQWLDPDGRVLAPLPAFADAESLLAMYRSMVRTRALDQKAILLQRTGQLGTYAACLGQEAIGTAIGSAMRAEDVFIPAYREYAAMFLRGVRPRDVLLYWGGDERGMDYAREPARHDFPLCVPIGTQLPHAIGVAYAMKLRREPRVALVSCGDGATSKGDFLESISAAGVWKLPLVVVISNNQWAISLPRSRQTAAETLAQKALAGGLRGEQVDGNDVVATRAVIADALDRARAGEGPTVIEALTYRLHDHTTADDARRYREEREVQEAWGRCPIRRLRAYLEREGLWSETDEAALQTQAASAVDTEVEAFLATPPPVPEAMFDFLYASLPKAFAAQREEARGGA